MKITEKIKNRIIENVKNLTAEELTINSEEHKFIYFSTKTGNKLKQKCSPARNKRKDVVFLHIW